MTVVLRKVIQTKSTDGLMIRKVIQTKSTDGLVIRKVIQTKSTDGLMIRSLTERTVAPLPKTYGRVDMPRPRTNPRQTQ